MTQTEMTTSDELGTARVVPEEADEMSTKSFTEAKQKETACSCPSCFPFDF